MNKTASVGSEGDFYSEWACVTHKARSQTCGFWTQKILRERERKRLFIEGLPHALYVLPHLILTDKVTEIYSEGFIFPSEPCALRTQRKRWLWQRTSPHAEAEHHVFDCTCYFSHLHIFWRFWWWSEEASLIERGVVSTLFPLLQRKAKPFPCTDIFYVTAIPQINCLYYWLDEKYPKYRKRQSGGLGVTAVAFIPPPCTTPISGHVCDMCELREDFTLLRGNDTYSHLWSKIK